MIHEPTQQSERVGIRRGRAPSLLTVAGALALTMVTSCSGDTQPIPTSPTIIGTTEKHDAEPLLHPKKVGRVVIFFVKTSDAALISPRNREILTKTVTRAAGDYHRSTLGFVPKLPVVNVGNYAIESPPLADRCSSDQATKDKLTKTLTNNAVAKAQQTGSYVPKSNDFRLIVTATKEPCFRNSAVDSVGAADNTALAGIIYDGNDEYEVPDTISHELGHGIVAAGHTGRVDCTRNNFCRRSPYGDLHSVMGNGSFIDRDLLNGWEMSRLGIIEKSQVVTLDSPVHINLRLYALLSKSAGPKIIRVPITSNEIRQSTGATYYLVEVSGAQVDEDMNKCASAIQCVTKKTLPPQGLSVKVYAVGNNRSAFYQDSTQIALREPKIGMLETGATRRHIGQRIFEEDGDNGLRMMLCGLRQTTRATGYADVQLAFQKTARLVCP